MSLETLQASQLEVASLMGVKPAEVRESQNIKVHRLGKTSVAGQDVYGFRAHCGPEDATGKGGIRAVEMDPADAFYLSGELSAEMYAKLAGRGIQGFKGAKGIITADFRHLGVADQQTLMRWYVEQMVEKGLAGPHRDVPAGDVGTNGLSDFYALGYRSLTGNPAWKASITGKSTDLHRLHHFGQEVYMGGLDARKGATGLGVYVCMGEERRRMNPQGDAEPHSVKIEGFGNVGSFAAHFASDDVVNFKVTAISDQYGMLSVPEGGDGMMITAEMVDEIGNNPAFKGDKMTALAEALSGQDIDITYTSRKDHPDAIYAINADWFIPAGPFPNVINEESLGYLQVRHGIVEAGNGVTTPGAHHLLVEQQKIVVPDIDANSTGVDCSIHEWRANLEEVQVGANAYPATEDINHGLMQSSISTHHRVRHMAEVLGITDLRQAAAGVQLAQLAVWNGIPIDSRFASLTVSAARITS